MDEMKEKQLKFNYPYHGKVVNMRVDEAELPDGRIVSREVVEHPGGVCIAMEDDEGRFFMVSQYRYAQEEVLLEFPAGKLEKGEDPYQSALREAVEETGYEALDMVEMGSFVPTGAYGQERVYLYYARQGAYQGQHLDFDEHLNVTKMTLDEIIQAIMNNQIIDGKTGVLAFKVRERKTYENK